MQEVWGQKVFASKITSPILGAEDFEDVCVEEVEEKSDCIMWPVQEPDDSVERDGDAADDADIKFPETELNSDDDQTIEDEPTETGTHLVCCLKGMRTAKVAENAKVRSITNKWRNKKFRFTEGIMYVNKREYAFKVAFVHVMNDG